MAEQIRDALRHLEKDMADILDILLDSQTTEIILNPYPTCNGRYSGYILVEQHGRGLHNLLRYHESTISSPQISVGDKVIYKYLANNPQQVLFWVKLNPSSNENLRNIALCLKSSFTASNITQTDDFALLNYSETLESGYIGNDEVLSQCFTPDGLLIQLNQSIPSNYRLACVDIESELYIERFRPYPNSIISSELVKMTASRAETIMSVLASITGKYLHNKQPYLECQIPKYGHRFTGVIPPVVPFPAFCIRKHAPQIYTLNDFVLQGVMQSTSRDTILNWIKRKFNILIAGGTGSGKTTLANAILYEISIMFPDARVLIIEDVAELKFNASRSIGFSISEFFSMYDALRTTLRFKPDRIVMGEVRGAEAYTLLKAWNTGHPGGLATIHANGVDEALYRFESCIRDHPNVRVNRQEIGFTVNAIIAIQNITYKEQQQGEYVNVVKRKITALRQIIAYDPDKDIYQDIVYDKLNEQL